MRIWIRITFITTPDQSHIGDLTVPTDEINLDEILRKVKIGLKSIYGENLMGVILYGSYARGDQKSGSDIDVAVLIRGEIDKYEEIERIVEVTNDISLEYEVLISVLPVTMDEYEKGILPIYCNIKREGVVV